ncbi:ribonuclease H-like domain-containing protein [Tanacetum coccineum]
MMMNILHLTYCLVSSIKPGGSYVADYYHRLNSPWREFDALTKLPTYTCDANEELGLHNQLMKLMQFLMGLDDCYQSVRCVLLTRDPLPEVKDAYATVFKEKSHKGFLSLLILINDTPSGNVHANMAGRPNGTLANISHIGHLKLTRLEKKIILGTGIESDGLYLFDMESNNSLCKVNMVFSCHVSKDLWHNRLGHPVDQVLKVLKKDFNCLNLPMCHLVRFILGLNKQ